MRITPIILILIGLAGFLYPEYFINENSGGGRWVFCIIILLGFLSFWRQWQRKKYDDHDL
ncbi:hypothetical protein MEG_00804 [Bartonella tamiae Th307]|uniref:Uncharacterized protein n=1 Tax=Bartonella tamiae Th239 TaxID=1094558 RepID=J1JZW1_9HYPH|nr:hypothetical protein [Bartonella tamiae]EJF90677.1 hypothetical protein ME5_01078 [Bartonella tamiae Th239]EJF93946.1 hypothetical protein MEG_00804 [Bartonella tamiae Th307]